MKEFKELISAIKRFHLHNRGYAFFSYFFGMIDIAFTSIMALAMKYLLDNAVKHEDDTLLLKVILFMLLGILLAKCSDILRRYLTAVFSSRTVTESRRRCFMHLQELSIRDFSDLQAGYLVGRFSTDMSAVHFGFPPCFDQYRSFDYKCRSAHYLRKEIPNCGRSA